MVNVFIETEFPSKVADIADSSRGRPAHHSRLSSDVKSAEGAARRFDRLPGRLDVTSHRLADRLNQVIDLIHRSFYDQFDVSVRQVSHGSPEAPLPSEPLRRLPKSHSLNVAGKDQGAPLIPLLVRSRRHERLSLVRLNSLLKLDL